jgi:hypothetical protein
MRTFTKDTALSENGRGETRHVRINIAWHGQGMACELVLRMIHKEDRCHSWWCHSPILPRDLTPPKFFLVPKVGEKPLRERRFYNLKDIENYVVT